MENAFSLPALPEVAGSAGDSGIFFVAVALTRMPMMVSDPNRPDCPIVFANEAFCALTGYSPQELVGRNCRILQGPDTDHAAVGRIREAVARRETVCEELLNYRKDGTPFWNALFISPVFEQGGALRYLFGAQVDVSRRHDTERALEQARRLESVGSLAGGIAHEFNNLLTVIQGNLEPLLASGTDPMTKRRLGRLQVAAERAATLTRSMIGFARQQRLQQQTIELRRALEHLQPILAEAAGAANSLLLDLETEEATIEADPAQLRTVLLDIVTNAKEALAAPGTITLGVRTRRSRAGEPVETVLTIRDNGAGMTPEVARSALDPFFSTKPPGSGTGLGLSTAYGFMRQSGGRLELQSRPGGGTTIGLAFPSRLPAPQADGTACRVLVADGDLGLREDAAKILRGLGYDVVAAASPGAALRMLADDPAIRAIVVEMALPGMSGLDLARRARRSHPALAVLLTTASPLGEGDGVLRKPYTRSALASRLREALEESRQHLPEGASRALDG
ncbi:MAG: PAS domain-containing protein [Acetobacteraceae bacterium]|nr:PAS domain-containing protein [Acetobacteraceae bacterium]